MKVKIDRKGVISIGKKLAALAGPINAATANRIGEAVTKEVRDQISKGISPIKGNGRFPRYKNPKRYPGDKKPRTPVNLNLSGAFMDSLTYKVYDARTGKGTEIFYNGEDSNGVSNQDKEQGHRDGANGQPKRPTLPSKSRGETFSARLIRIVRDIYNEAISSIVKR